MATIRAKSIAGKSEREGHRFRFKSRIPVITMMNYLKSIIVFLFLVSFRGNCFFSQSRVLFLRRRRCRFRCNRVTVSDRLVVFEKSFLPKISFQNPNFTRPKSLKSGIQINPRFFLLRLAQKVTNARENHVLKETVCLNRFYFERKNFLWLTIYTVINGLLSPNCSGLYLLAIPSGLCVLLLMALLWKKRPWKPPWRKVRLIDEVATKGVSVSYITTCINERQPQILLLMEVLIYWTLIWNMLHKSKRGLAKEMQKIQLALIKNMRQGSWNFIVWVIAKDKDRFRCVRRFKSYGSESSQTTYQNFCLIRMMLKAFRSLIYKMLAYYKCMKKGLNRLILLPVRLPFGKQGYFHFFIEIVFNFLYLFQWLYLNGFVNHVNFYEII